MNLLYACLDRADCDDKLYGSFKRCFIAMPSLYAESDDVTN